MPSFPVCTAATPPGSGGSGAQRLQHLVVTRPAAEAGRWVQALCEQGWPAQALPLIEIGVPQDAATLASLAHWRQHWHSVDAVFFVSGAAVQHFFAAGSLPARGATEGPRLWAPGPGTAQALVRLGVDAARIDAPPADASQFDSEALWAVVAPQVRPGRQILLVRGVSPGAQVPAEPGLGGSGRDWMIQQIQSRGAQLSACVAYERRAPVFSTTDRALLNQATSASSLWLFSSSEALDHLVHAAPELAWDRCAALVTHPRIAAAARAAGFSRVVETRPALADVLSTLESVWRKP
ncbi:uroporphyrinogen-III synthase [Hydrogenophaga sp.]|uniref:uroporphyrinogen-III synthase n=1 Tax=Hydrogenophaga sp. TaxID=1904254 RepID=UPI003565727F